MKRKDKPIYVKSIEIPNKEVRELNKILKRKTSHPDWKDGAVIQTFTVAFDQISNKKFEADIKVCNAPSPYVDPVLFEVIEGIGHEVYVGELTDSLLGEYHFNIDEGEFIVNVISKN